MQRTLNRLGAHDVADMKALNQLFSEVFDDPSYSELPPDEAYLASFLHDPNHIVLVALEGERLVGGLVAYVIQKFEQSRSELYVYDLAVATDRQRLGIGRQLIDEIRALAADIGAYVVFLQADEADEAVRFYEALEPIENLRARNFDFAPKPRMK